MQKRGIAVVAGEIREERTHMTPSNHQPYPEETLQQYKNRGTLAEGVRFTFGMNHYLVKRIKQHKGKRGPGYIDVVIQEERSRIYEIKTIADTRPREEEEEEEE